MRPSFANAYQGLPRRARIKALKSELYDEAANAIDCYEDGTGRNLSTDPAWFEAKRQVHRRVVSPIG